MNLLSAYIDKRRHIVLGKDVWTDMLVAFRYPDDRGYLDTIAGFFVRRIDGVKGERIRVCVPLSPIKHPVRTYRISDIQYFYVLGYASTYVAYLVNRSEFDPVYF